MEKVNVQTAVVEVINLYYDLQEISPKTNVKEISNGSSTITFTPGLIKMNLRVFSFGDRLTFYISPKYWVYLPVSIYTYPIIRQIKDEIMDLVMNASRKLTTRKLSKKESIVPDLFEAVGTIDSFVRKLYPNGRMISIELGDDFHGVFKNEKAHYSAEMHYFNGWDCREFKLSDGTIDGEIEKKDLDFIMAGTLKAMLKFNKWKSGVLNEMV